MRRRDFLKMLGVGAFAKDAAPRRPNVLLIHVGELRHREATIAYYARKMQATRK